ncbi:MAG TPA: MBL fold metallo-hydrolase [Flavobacteriaceae bacterium]|nr:MBL fold metallo-hydrolase [Flavobacteriaceae bacterium]
MKIIFFGTSAGRPTNNRSMSAIGLQSELDKWSLFDCGDGTSFQITKSNWNLSKLDSIFITHLHADHFLGILSVIFIKNMNLEENCNLTVYAPKGLKEFVQKSLEISKKVIRRYRLKIIEIEDGMYITQRNMNIEVVSMLHSSTPCFGFYIESIKRKIIIAGDNENPEIFKERLNDLDLLIHEATFLEEDYRKDRKKTLHTTAKLLGKVANKYNVKKVIATHINKEYNTLDKITELYDEIALNYKSKLYIANDLNEFEV